MLLLIQAMPWGPRPHAPSQSLQPTAGVGLHAHLNLPWTQAHDKSGDSTLPVPCLRPTPSLLPACRWGAGWAPSPCSAWCQVTAGMARRAEHEGRLGTPSAVAAPACARSTNMTVTVLLACGTSPTAHCCKGPACNLSASLSHGFSSSGRD